MAERGDEACGVAADLVFLVVCVGACCLLLEAGAARGGGPTVGSGR